MSIDNPEIVPIRTFEIVHAKCCRNCVHSRRKTQNANVRGWCMANECEVSFYEWCKKYKEEKRYVKATLHI